MQAEYTTAKCLQQGHCYSYWSCCVIGTGVQEVYNTLCMLHLLKNIKIYDSYGPSITKYIEQMKPFIGDKIKVEEATSFHAAMDNADMVIAATAMLHKPVIIEYLRPTVRIPV